MNNFRNKTSVVLDNILKKNENLVVAGTPSGPKSPYFKIVKKHKKQKDLIPIHLIDKPENILNRLTFCDEDYSVNKS